MVGVGDAINLNDAATFIEVDSQGQVTLKAQTPPGREWATFKAQLPENPRFFPGIGNHEAYKRLPFFVKSDAGGKLQPAAGTEEIRAKETQFNSALEIRSQFTKEFPWLETTAGVTRDTETASYVVQNQHLCLIEADANPSAKTVTNFLAKVFATCSQTGLPIILVTHFPFFSPFEDAKAAEEFAPEFRASLLSLMHQFHVALAITGHTHMYTRFRPAGIDAARFAAADVGDTTFVTVSTFGGDYRSEGRKKLDGVKGADGTWKKPAVGRVDPANPVVRAEQGKGVVSWEDSTYQVLDVRGDGIKFRAYAYQTDGSWSPLDAFTISKTSQGNWQLTEETPN